MNCWKKLILFNSSIITSNICIIDTDSIMIKSEYNFSNSFASMLRKFVALQKKNGLELLVYRIDDTYSCMK